MYDKDQTCTRKKVEMENKELIEEIKTVLVETGINPRKWTKLANELNERSIFTKGGKPWTLMNLKNFCERYILIEDSITPDIQMSDKDNIDESGMMEEEEPNDIGLDTLVLQKSDSKKDQVKRNELIDQIKTVLSETGINPRKWTKLVKELNNRSIFTKGGKPWTLMNLKNFCLRYILIEESITTDMQISDQDNIDESGMMEEEEPNDIGLDTLVIQRYDSIPSDDNTTDIQLGDSKLSGNHLTGVLQQTGDNDDVIQLSDNFSDEEIKVLKQLVRERLIPKHLPMRIEFDRRKTYQKTVRISAELFDDVKKRESNFSKLVELLLWEYMDRDPKYLKKT
jgi:transcriptional regulator of met regulon